MPAINKATASLGNRSTPFRFLMITAGSIFIAEVLVMLILLVLPRMFTLVEVFVDAFLLIIMVFPVLHIFLFRPLVSEIAERKGVEDNLQKHRDHLEELVEERTVQLKQEIAEHKEAEQAMVNLNEQLKKTNNELKDFVYIASHDLREPLRKIMSFSSLLKQSLPAKITDDDDKENLDFVIEGAERMTKMVEGLLAYSWVSTKNQSLEIVNVDEIIEQLEEFELAVLIKGKNVTINIPQPLLCIEVDRDQIRQLLLNLIANGIKYQKPGATPIITVTSIPADDGMVKIEVKDNGIGIKPQYQQTIFNMFKRLHSRSEYKGTGTGLTVCKKIVELYSGDIGVESEYGKGSTFWFTLPEAEVCSEAVLQS